MEKIGMVSTFIKFFFILALVGYVVNGCFLAPSFDYSLIWSHPITTDTESVQEIEVPFVKYGNTFSICFDKLTDKSIPGYSIHIEDFLLYRDKIEASFTIGDTVFFYEEDYLKNLDYYGKKFDDIRIGYSTNESPDNYSSVGIAIGKGATVFESCLL